MRERRTLLLFLLLFGLSLGVPPLSEKYELYRRFLEAKDPALGKRLLKEYPNAPFKNELLLLLAERLAKDRPAEARSYLRRVNLRKAPPERVIKLWKRLGLPERPLLLAYPERFAKKVLRLKLSRAEKERVAKRLFRRRKYELVVKLTKNCYLLGVSYYRLGKREKAEKVLKACPAKRAKRYLLYAYVSRGKEEELERLLEREGDPLLYYLAGREYLERRRLRKAERYLKRAGKEGEAPFYLGILYFLKGDYEKAYRAFLTYDPKKTVNKAKRSFWLFKSALNAGKGEEALKRLREASRYENFYGAVARLLLGLPVREFTVKVEGGRPYLYFELKRIKELGFTHYMRVEAFRHKSLVTKGDLLLLVKTDPYTAIRLAANKFGTASEVYKALSHPTPYEGIVRQVSRHFKVSPPLIYAVMRQESLFDPYAVSPAGAKGLMQLMDFTARWKAKRLGIKIRSLFDPYTNVLLGTAYLRFLMDYWKGDLVRVIASYNAGQGAVAKWPRYADEFLFIELIPYRETRKYVKRVLYNYYVYWEKLKESF